MSEEDKIKMILKIVINQKIVYNSPCEMKNMLKLKYYVSKMNLK